MPYNPHTLLAFGGRLTEGSSYGEIWECTLRGGSTNNSDNTHLVPFDVGDLDRVAEDVAGAIGSWWTGSSSLIPSSVSLDYVKANNITAAGKYAEPITHVYEITPAKVGTQSSNAPNFCTVALTLETGLQRGRAHRGRMYLPNFSITYQGAVLSESVANGVRDAGVALLNAIIQSTNEGSLEDKFAPAVCSRLDASWHYVQGVSVDSVYDVQRRRKNQAPSFRTTVADLTL